MKDRGRVVGASRGDGLIGAVAVRFPERGFTLLEVLLATALLATAMALAFATVRAATAVVTRGEVLAERTARIRAVHGFLRERITGAQGIVWGLGGQSGTISRFQGGPGRMRFAADLPPWLGRGGPHVHTVALAGTSPALRLEVDFAMVQAGQVAAAGAIPPELLADGLVSVAFAYRGLGADGSPGPWQTAWERPESMPLQVRVDIVDAAGPWPTLLVALPLAGAHAATPGPPR